MPSACSIIWHRFGFVILSRSRLTSKLARPTLPSMQHRYQLQPPTPNTIRNEKGRPGNHKLTSSKNPPWPPQLRVAFEPIHRVDNPARNQSCARFRVPLDISSQRHQMAKRSPRPHNSHRGGFVSADVPHEFSHFDTFSWLTSCPASRSDIPASISPNCHSSAATYAAIASAARNDFVRRDCFARASRRCRIPASIRTERVSVIQCTHCIHCIRRARCLFDPSEPVRNAEESGTH
jgi:hypothetical protein